jgi:hypothetical protein
MKVGCPPCGVSQGGKTSDVPAAGNVVQKSYKSVGRIVALDRPALDVFHIPLSRAEYRKTGEAPEVAIAKPWAGALTGDRGAAGRPLVG